MKFAKIMDKRLLFTLLVALCIWSLLIWQYFHDGVPSHHLLQRNDLPSISNWWGGILLPFLTWFLVGRINMRKGMENSNEAIGGFVGALFYGIALSASFVYDFGPVSSLIVPGLLVIALFLPIYRSQYFLGFVLGTSYTFGALLPMGFGVVVALISFAIYNFLRPIPQYIFRKISSEEKA